jgi:hypothetical protein
MKTDTRIDGWTASQAPEFAWLIVGLLGLPLAAGWLWLAWGSPLALLCWVCLGAMLRYWHGGNVRWTHLAKNLFAVILIAPLATGILIPVEYSDASLISVSFFGYIFAAVFTMGYFGPIGVVTGIAAVPVLYGIWTLPESLPSETAIPLFLLGGLVAIFVDPTATGILMVASLFYCVLVLLFTWRTTASIGLVTVLFAVSVGLAGIVGTLAKDGLVLMTVGCIFVLFGTLIAMAKDAPTGSELQQVTQFHEYWKDANHYPLTGIGLLVFAGLLLVLSIDLSEGELGLTPMIAFKAITASLLALGLWLLPGVLGCDIRSRTRHLRSAGLCQRDLHRLRPEPDLPWMLRWTGRTLYEEVPRQHDGLAVRLLCRHCGGQDIIVARCLLGVIGALPGTPDTDDERHVLLYEAATGQAISADIDRLDLYPPPPGTGLDWDHAVNAVVNALSEDHHRSHPLKRIPVRLHGGLVLPANARRVLDAHFANVTVLG